MSGQTDPLVSIQDRDRDRSAEYDDAFDGDDDDGDGARLLPESDLIVEQIRNELGNELIGADLYTRASRIYYIRLIR
jgi:hypothetical protein